MWDVELGAFSLKKRDISLDTSHRATLVEKSQLRSDDLRKKEENSLHQRNTLNNFTLPADSWSIFAKAEKNQETAGDGQLPKEAVVTDLEVEETLE